MVLSPFGLLTVGTSTASPKTMKPEASQGVHSDLFADRSGDDFAVQKQNAIVPHGDGFPKAALLLVDALKKNRAYQKFIRRKMVNIEAKIEENKDLRDRVKCLLGYQLSCRKSVSRSLGQKEDPRVRLISPLKSTQPCTKVLTSVFTAMCWMLQDTLYSLI
jgi:transcription factor MYB, plant